MTTVGSRRSTCERRQRYELQVSLSTWNPAHSALAALWRIHLEDKLCWRRLSLRQEARLREKAGAVLAEIATAPERALREIVERAGDLDAWFTDKLWPFRAPKWQRLRWQYTHKP